MYHACMRAGLQPVIAVASLRLSYCTRGKGAYTMKHCLCIICYWMCSIALPLFICKCWELWEPGDAAQPL